MLNGVKTGDSPINILSFTMGKKSTIYIRNKIFLPIDNIVTSHSFLEHQKEESGIKEKKKNRKEDNDPSNFDLPPLRLRPFIVIITITFIICITK